MDGLEPAIDVFPWGCRQKLGPLRAMVWNFIPMRISEDLSPYSVGRVETASRLRVDRRPEQSLLPA
jgi:hypothetical protein